MKFSEKLQKLRKSNNVSQEQLADKLCVTRQAVSKWESGQGYPEIDKLILLSDILQVSLDYLLKEDNTNATVNNNIKLDLKDRYLLIYSYFKKLPKKYQTLIWIIVIGCAIIIPFNIFNSSYNAGHTLGRALYYITHLSEL